MGLFVVIRSILLEAYSQCKKRSIVNLFKTAISKAIVVVVVVISHK